MSQRPQCAHVTDETDIPYPCHWRAEPDGKHCIFHRPVADKDDDVVTREFVRAIEGRRDDELVEIGTETSPRALAKEFVGATFGQLDLSNTAVDAPDTNRIEFTHCEIGELYLYNATVDHPIEFVESEIEGFQWTRADFARSVQLRDCTVGVGVANGATFARNFRLTSSRMTGGLSLIGARFLRECLVGGLETPTTDVRLINLRRSRIADGHLSVLDGHPLLFNLTEATIGNVTLATDTPMAERLRYFRLQLTSFENFDFAAHERMFIESAVPLYESIEPNFELLHQGLGPRGVPSIVLTNPFEDDDGSDLVERRNTYLKARNGAADAGANTVASKFFVAEMRYRRQEHRERLASATSIRDRVQAGEDLVANCLLGWTTGYGERPRRVIGASVSIVVLFAFAFAITRPEQPYGSPIGYLVLSLESFVTLVLAPSVRVDDIHVRLLAQIEGFVGVFMIGLFVFALTRSIDR